MQSDANLDANDSQYFVEADDLNAAPAAVLGAAEDEKAITG